MSAQGCAFISKAIQVIVLAGDITFAFAKADLSPQAKTQLEELINRIEVGFIKTLKIVGHTDSVGSQESNQILSEKRAQTVSNYLIDLGIPFEKIIAQGKGEKEAIASNVTKIGRAKNRRAEIKIIRFQKK